MWGTGLGAFEGALAGIAGNSRDWRRIGERLSVVCRSQTTVPGVGGDGLRAVVVASVPMGWLAVLSALAVVKAWCGE